MKQFFTLIFRPSLLLLLLGCCLHPISAQDMDNDGYDANMDCDDNNPMVYMQQPLYMDADGDGHGGGMPLMLCQAPGMGYVMVGDDCDDTNPAVLNMDQPWYADADNDGFGDPATMLMSCPQPFGYVLDNTDCNDNNININPDTQWFLDADGDLYGSGVATGSCTAPGANYVNQGGDCNDVHAGITPATQWYVDADNDGFGDLTQPVGTPGCTAPTGMGTVAPNGGDCNDANGSITYPTAVPATTGSLATYFADHFFTGADGWTHYYSCAHNVLLLSLKRRTWNPGTLVMTDPPQSGQFAIRVDVGAAATVDLLGGGAKAPNYPLLTTEWIVMNRTWDVELYALGQEPIIPVGVRSYYNDSDFDAINTALDPLNDTPASRVPAHNQLNHYKLVNISPLFANKYANSMSALADFHDNITSGEIISYHPNLQGASYVHGEIGTTGNFAEYAVNSFSGGGGGGGLGGAVAFPVELTHFVAVSQTGITYLSWNTASEQNMSWFVVERSTSNGDFIEVGRVQAIGNSAANQSYAFEALSVAGVAYYRLRMIEADGRVSFSEIEEVQMAVGAGIAATISPNPFHSEVALYIVSAESGTAHAALTDLYGKVLITKQLMLEAGGNTATLETQGLASGVYLIEITQAGRKIQYKVVKK